MTTSEFRKYIADNYGDLYNISDEDLREIICIYKLFVSPEEKRDGNLSWSELAYVLNSELSGKQLADKAWYYLNKHPEYEIILRQKFCADEEESPVEEPFNTDMYKQKTKLKDLLNDYRRLIREEARLEELKDCIQSAAKTVPTYIAKSCSRPVKRNSKEAILLLSDWHIGAEVSNFYNTYNSKIAGLELEHLVEEVKNYCNKFDIDRLNILNMGDLIHGGIHTNARIGQEFDVITQVEVAGQLLYKCLSELESAAPSVTYRSCSDNHSRFMANKSEHIEKEYFGRLIDWWLEAKLWQGGHNIELINDNLDFGLGKFELLNGKKVMFAHGHEDPINQAYQNFTGAAREFIDYILLAHFHNPKEKNFQDARVIVNGSLVGTEQYALSKRLFTTPCQKLLIFDDNFVDITLNANNYR